MAASRGPALAPWRFMLWGSAALLAMAAWLVLAQPGVDGVRALIRATARTSLFFFLLAYTASALHTVWPARVTRVLRQHRRQWGLLLVVSHGIHAVGIAALASMAPALFLALSPVASRVGPGLAYVVLVAMGATSFDRTAAWLGRAGWARLHTWGAHYLWLSFVVANGKRVAAQPVYALPVALLALALALRWWAAWRRRAHNQG